jgi:hypothetical protein
MAKKKSLEDLCVEFFAIWEAYWESGATDGPSFSELEKALKKIKSKVQSIPE